MPGAGGEGWGQVHPVREPRQRAHWGQKNFAPWFTGRCAVSEVPPLPLKAALLCHLGLCVAGEGGGGGGGARAGARCPPGGPGGGGEEGVPGLVPGAPGGGGRRRGGQGWCQVPMRASVLA